MKKVLTKDRIIHKLSALSTFIITVFLVGCGEASIDEETKEEIEKNDMSVEEYEEKRAFAEREDVSFGDISNTEDVAFSDVGELEMPTVRQLTEEENDQGYTRYAHSLAYSGVIDIWVEKTSDSQVQEIASRSEELDTDVHYGARSYREESGDGFIDYHHLHVEDEDILVTYRPAISADDDIEEKEDEAMIGENVATSFRTDEDTAILEW
ncbi:hypothetical protein [Salisediminibacterium halotolerans]|uniref:hypothetical protein n=1 Tax=Salisediminibacterium halotolerans TaxID=517425 RepID=UPI0013152A5E|nr:hypothetical protein [Salisediminibacterium halotolerans]